MRGDQFLGIDIGSTRVRATLRRRSTRAAGLEAIAMRDVPAGACENGVVREPELVAALLDEIVEELRARRAQCVCAVGPPFASLRAAAFPRMSQFERVRAARIDLKHQLQHALDDVVIRVHPLAGAEKYAVGSVLGTALRSRLTALRKAGLRPHGVDFEGLALLRAHPEAHAVLDIAADRTVLHAAVDDLSSSWWSGVGGATITAAIGADLGIDERTAEDRKRVLGTNGAGESAVLELAREAASLIEAARRRCTIERIAVVGNGSRVAGLRAAMERAATVVTVVSPSRLWGADTYPSDVTATLTAEWSLAAGLSLWNG